MRKLLKRVAFRWRNRHHDPLTKIMLADDPKLIKPLLRKIAAEIAEQVEPALLKAAEDPKVMKALRKAKDKRTAAKAVDRWLSPIKRLLVIKLKQHLKGKVKI